MITYIFKLKKAVEMPYLAGEESRKKNQLPSPPHAPRKAYLVGKSKSSVSIYIKKKKIGGGSIVDLQCCKCEYLPVIMFFVIKVYALKGMYCL